MHEEADRLRWDLFTLYDMYYGKDPIDVGPESEDEALNRITNEHNFKEWIDQLRRRILGDE
jgi:hypothetical protein